MPNITRAFDGVRIAVVGRDARTLDECMTQLRELGAVASPRTVLSELPAAAERCTVVVVFADDFDADAISTVVDTALSFEKEKRFASARQMQKELRSASAALEPTVAAGMQLPAALAEEYERRKAAKRAAAEPAQPAPPQVSSTRTLPLDGALENEPIPLKVPRK